MKHALAELAKSLLRGEFRLFVERRWCRKAFQKVFGASAESINNYYSQHSQDFFINNFIFRGKREGVFVEIGAHDGIQLSNTYFFEKELGWKGICIEPNPLSYAKLVNNRSCIKINCGVASKETTLKFLRLPSDLELGSGFIDYFQDSSPYKKEKFIEDISNKGGGIISIQVCELNSVLKKHEFDYIDFLSIDTEGADYDILTSIDFENFYIDVISVENVGFENKIISYLSKKGYELRAILGNDEIYKRTR